MRKKYTLDELKKEFPGSWKHRDEYGSYRWKSPEERDSSTWNEADREYVRMKMAEKAERILGDQRSRGKVSEVQRMLIEEMQKLTPQPAYQPPYENESIFDDEVEYTPPSAKPNDLNLPNS